MTLFTLSYILCIHHGMHNTETETDWCLSLNQTLDSFSTNTLCMIPAVDNAFTVLTQRHNMHSLSMHINECRLKQTRL